MKTIQKGDLVRFNADSFNVIDKLVNKIGIVVEMLLDSICKVFCLNKVWVSYKSYNNRNSFNFKKIE